MSESNILCSESWMWTTLEPNHLADSKRTRAQYRPHLLLIKNSFVLNSLLYFLLQSVIKVFVEKWYFVESWAERVLKLCIRSLEVKDMLMFLWKLLGKVYEGLLIGLLVCEWVLFYKMEASIRVLSDNWSISNLPNCHVIAWLGVLALVCLAHLN